MTPPTGPDIADLIYVRHLGSGGYADVYLYERRSPKMNVAVKVLNEGKLTATELAQFEAEAETMAELADHPYIVQVFSADRTADGRPYLVMKYYPRDNLARRAARERLPVADVLRVGVQISSAVETAHRAKILHRDIKPANILVSQYGEPGLTDFGIAGRASDSDDSDEIGVSVPWTAPEVLGGSSNGSVQSDVYSLAATVWTLLVGRSPFEVPNGDNSVLALMGRVTNSPAPNTARADVPDSLERLLQHAMAKNPASRPRTALEFAQALQGIEQEQRFGRTDLVIEGFGHAGERRTRPLSDENETRARAQRVVAQPRSASVEKQFDSSTKHRPTIIDVSPPADRTPVARERIMPEDEAFPSTFRRADLNSTEAMKSVEGRRRRGVRPRTVVLAASGIGLVAVVVGIIFASSGSSEMKNDGVPTPRASDQTDIPVLEVTSPVVSSTYDAETKLVTFRWHALQSEPGDSYVWSPAGSPQNTTRTGATSVTLKSNDPSATCVQVVLVRSDGSSSQPSSSVCGPAK